MDVIRISLEQPFSQAASPIYISSINVIGRAINHTLRHGVILFLPPRYDSVAKFEVSGCWYIPREERC